MDKFLVNTANVVEFDIGVVASGTPTIVVTNGAGESHVAATNTSNPSEGVYRISLTPAQCSVLDTYKATLSASINGQTNLFTSRFEVVGGAYFSIDEARAFRGNKLANATTYPTQSIHDAKEEIEELIESICGRAFVERGRRVTLNGDASAVLPLPDLRVNEIYSVKVTDSAGVVDTFDATELADLSITEYGYLRRDYLGTFTQGYRNVAVHYAHGETQVPGPIKRAALILLLRRLIDSNVSDRATNFNDESGSMEFWRPTERRPTGYPEVDAILATFSDHRVGVA